MPEVGGRGHLMPFEIAEKSMQSVVGRISVLKDKLGKPSIPLRNGRFLSTSVHMAACGIAHRVLVGENLKACAPWELFDKQMESAFLRPRATV
jgi:hypothetical protein